MRTRRVKAQNALDITAPKSLSGDICLPVGYIFDDGETVKALQSGKFTLTHL